MANTDEKVMEMVMDELRKEPDIETSALHDRVKSVFPHIGKLTLRQFNARYPLQIKRRQTMQGGKKQTPKKTRKTRKTRKTNKAAKTESTTKAAKKTRTSKTRKTRKRSGPRSRRAAAPAASGRDAVRHVLLGFAADLSAADDRSDVVRVLADVDGYVDRLMTAAGS